MSLCQECGSEISEADLFCPFCGISIVRPSQPEPVVDESMESTIVITPAQAEELKRSAAADSPSIKAGADIAPAENEPSITSRTAPTLEDIPTPMILSSGFARQTDPNVAFDPGSKARDEQPHDADSVPTPPHGMRIDEEAEELSDSGAPEIAYAVTEESVSIFSSEEQPEASPSPDAYQLAEPEVEPVFSEPVGENEPAPLKETGFDSAEGPIAEEKAEPVEASHEQETAQESFEKEEVAEAPVAISKPLEHLEETPSTPSMFDSVRIMDGGIPSSPSNADNIDTIIPGRGMFPGMQSQPKIQAEPEPSKPSPEATGHSLGTSDTDGRRSAKLKPLPEGTVLNGRYEIVRKIGGGGMGAVYLASDNNLGGVLRAVKEMVQAHIEEDQQEKAINDFKRESMILSTLDHPSIPTIYDYFYDAGEGRFYLVMKYISGGDLASRLRGAPEGKIEEMTVTEWAIQITDVLNYLHNQPTTIVYRDLKPSNLMLDGNSSRVMLIDFGIARNISQKEEKGVTAVGTMGYAPPELFSGNVEPRSDIYSLGSTMFHLLTGADPQSNPLLIFDFQKNPRPRQINSRLSDQMERILMRSVEYNSDARFGTAAEMKAVLEEHLAKLRSGSVTYGVSEAPVSVSLANQSVFCGFCGQRIVATDLFCAFCGAKQPIAQQGVHSEIYQAAAPTARLVIEGTSELSAPIYALQKDENLIGRRDPMSNIFPEVDLSKFDPQTKISRRHAKIWRDGTSFMLEDLGSSNGTLIEGSGANSFRLPAHKPYRLSSGDRIKIGDTRLHFVVG